MRIHAPTLALLFAVFCTVARADDGDYLFDAGPLKIVIMNATKSGDGHYALGWTLTRRNKKAEAVDWSLWDTDPTVMLDHYHTGLAGNGSASKDYPPEYFVVDLRNKKALKIPADYQYIHGDPYTGGAIDAAWSGDVDGKRYGIFEFAYIGGSGVFLASLTGKEMQLMDTGGMDQVVQAQLPKHTPLDRYSLIYRVTEDSAGRKLPVFHGPYADIGFHIGIRHDADSPSADGILTLRLADGAVTHVTPTDGEDDEAEAIRDNPELRKADAELNDVYLALENKLPPAAREALKKEQRAWIEERDKAVDNAGSGATDGAAETAMRDKAQLELTHKRTAELKTRLASQH